MGCYLSRLIEPDTVLVKSDGAFKFHVITGGLTLIRGYVQQNIPGGTLFVTDTRLIHYTKCCGLNHIDFELAAIKDLEATSSFGADCSMHYPCCTSCPDSYIQFKTKIDGREHRIGIKVKDSQQVAEDINFNRTVKVRNLTVITEESSPHHVELKIN